MAWMTGWLHQGSGAAASRSSLAKPTLQTWANTSNNNLPTSLSFFSSLPSRYIWYRLFSFHPNLGAIHPFLPSFDPPSHLRSVLPCLPALCPTSPNELRSCEYIGPQHAITSFAASPPNSVNTTSQPFNTPQARRTFVPTATLFSLVEFPGSSITASPRLPVYLLLLRLANHNTPATKDRHIPTDTHTYTTLSSNAPR
jgi:hypothetical protein